MSNWIDYDLDVLASDPAEINQIAERLKRPSPELVSRLAERSGQPVSDIGEGLKELLEFKATTYLGYLDERVNKARRFHNSFEDRYTGIVDNQICDVSQAFPSATFLLLYRDMQLSDSGKSVIRAGELVRHVHDGDQAAQASDWALLDIFAPFRAEYQRGLEFGSLWKQWVDDMAAAAKALVDSTDAETQLQQALEDAELRLANARKRIELYRAIELAIDKVAKRSVERNPGHGWKVKKLVLNPADLASAVRSATVCSTVVLDHSWDVDGNTGNEEQNLDFIVLIDDNLRVIGVFPDDLIGSES